MGGMPGMGGMGGMGGLSGLGGMGGPGGPDLGNVDVSYHDCHDNTAVILPTGA